MTQLMGYSSSEFKPTFSQVANYYFTTLPKTKSVMSILKPTFVQQAL